MSFKTINALMKYLRDKHDISIKGSKDKQNLYNIGYYHSYKGYRYFKNPDNKLNIKSFDDIVNLYRFDNDIKSLLYKPLLEIETITKNRVLQIVVEKYNTNNFADILNCSLKGKKSNQNTIRSSIQLQNKIYNELSRGYKDINNNIVNHFLAKGESVPIWGIFELVSLGVFGDFIKCMEDDTRRIISKDMGLLQSYDTNACLPEKIIYLLKPLRNAIAHNSIIFDVRFSDHGVDKTLCKLISYDTQIQNISFDCITDYFILIIYLLKKYGISREELSKIINDYISIVEDFRRKIDYSIFYEVIHTDFKPKMEKLTLFIK